MWLRRGAPPRGFELLVSALVALLASVTLRGAAQPIDPPVLRTPTPSPSPTATPKPTPTPTAQPQLSPPPRPTAPAPIAPSPDPTDVPPTPEPLLVVPLPADPLIAGPVPPPGVHIPVLPRTPGRNTVRLVRALERLAEYGVPIEQVLVQGMGRIPVGGLTFWSDDWQNPRFSPFFHLHEGVDMFAEFGTPVRAPDRGVITRLSDGPVGGIGAWMTARDGVQYYFAHMQGYANGVAEGMQVDVGTVIGFVGDTGNARGGAPHLHFEIHRGGAVPPKPYVDAWLLEAERNAQAWIDAQIRSILAERSLLRSQHALAGLLAADGLEPAGTPEYSILLTLLDPVAGSVGLLPELSLVPQRAAGSGLLEELIRQRVEGALIATLAGGPRND